MSTQPAVVFSYEANKEDYLYAIGLYYRRQTGTWLTLLVVVFLFGLGIVGMAGGEVEGQSRLPLSILGFVLMPLLMALMLLPIWRGIRQFERSERARAEITWEVDNQRIHTRSAYGEGTVDWGTYCRALEDERVFLLFYTANPRMFVFIPKRAFTLPADLQAFRDLLKQHLRMKG